MIVPAERYLDVKCCHVDSLVGPTVPFGVNPHKGRVKDHEVGWRGILVRGSHLWGFLTPPKKYEILLMVQKSHSQPPGMVLKPCKIWSIYHINWLISRISFTIQ